MKMTKNKKWFISSLIGTALAGAVFFTMFGLGLFKHDSVQANTPTAAKKTIIIDPGHGGVDGGAVSKDGVVEKGINLSIAQKLRDLLTASGYEIIMTRDTDISIHDEDAATIRRKKTSDLHNRLKIINNYPDAIFVSIHQNYYTSSQYKGTQVFYSPNNPESQVLATALQDSIVSMLQPDNTREIKQSNKSIFLLHNAKIPAVMVECGFLSNAEDTALLQTDDYQNSLAYAIMCGITNYYQQ